jgi:hypothetical protein
VIALIEMVLFQNVLRAELEDGDNRTRDAAERCTLRAMYPEDVVLRVGDFPVGARFSATARYIARRIGTGVDVIGPGHLSS